jgi:hypothetical protein
MKHDFRVAPCRTTPCDQIRINPNCFKHCRTYDTFRQENIASYKCPFRNKYFRPIEENNLCSTLSPNATSDR